MSLRSCIMYFIGVLRHKWYVAYGCRVMGVSLWQAIIHDWTKFLPREFFPYVRQFYNSDGSKRDVRDKSGAYDPSAQPEDFQRAWISHQRNKHHWQAWISIGNSGHLFATPMPDKYIREMVADWIGAGMSYSGRDDPLPWYDKNSEDMLLHPDTRCEVERYVNIAHMISVMKQRK